MTDDNPSPPKKTTQAFTLIELLVVIAIIAILMGVLAPTLQKAKERTRETVCKSNLKSLGLCIQLYLQDNDYRTPDSSRTNGYFWRDTTGNIRSTTDRDAYWAVAYKDVIKDTKICGCPSYRKVAELLYATDPKLILHAAFGLNANVSNKKTTQIQKPSQFIICHDHVEPKIEQGSIDMFYNDGPGTMNLRVYRPGGERSRFYRGIFRHNIRYNDAYKTGGRANILWLDTHADSLEETTGDNVLKTWYTGE